MSILNIRNLPEDVHRRLRLRAAKAGRSMEAEARAILTAVCRQDVDARSLQDLVDVLYGADKPAGVADDLIQERRRESASD